VLEQINGINFLGANGILWRLYWSVKEL